MYQAFATLTAGKEGAMARLVSDSVWQQLDPYAGRLSARTARRLRVGAAIVAIAAVSAGALGWSGLIVPNIGWPRDGGWGASTSPELITHEVVVENKGWAPVEVLGMGRSGAGLELVEVRGTFPTTLEAGQTMQAELVYRVTDCAAVTDEPWPVPVRVRRPWGVHTSYVELPDKTSWDAPSAYSYTGRNPYAVEWQRWLADMSCAYR
jgi:hypothetical protein